MVVLNRSPTRPRICPLFHDGRLPAVISFPLKICESLKFTVTKVGEHAENIGLSEIVITNQK